MRANWGIAARRSRHFDRAFGLIAVSLLVACSAGGIGGTGGSGGTGETGGTGGTWDAGGTGDTGDTGEADGGSDPPVCAGGAPPFGVCFVNDADVLPLPHLEINTPATGTNGPAAATIVNVGTGTAPAQCESARKFGARGTSDWWFQAQTTDRLWTIGVHGLGNTPLVRKDDSVTLDLAWRGTTDGNAYGWPVGQLQLSDAAATPLLWSAAMSGGTPTSGPGWLMLAPGVAVCRTTDPCDSGGYDVVFTVKGSMATLPPFGAADIGGYHVANGALIKGASQPQCYDAYGQAYAAAAAKVP